MTATPDNRALLVTSTNPNARTDYMVMLEGRLNWGNGAVVALRYVPDRLILERAAFAAYLTVLGGVAWDNLEHCAATLLEDVNNELVPRWVQVAVTSPAASATGVSHAILLEDRQPRWDNSSLLQRLRPW